MTAPLDIRIDIARQILGRAASFAPPVGLRDQYQAAATDALGILGGLGAVAAAHEPDRGWRSAVADITEDKLAAALAAILPLRRCPHLRCGGPQPSLALLPQRRLVCRRCAQTVTRRLIPDHACDLCEQPTTMFMPVGVRVAQVVIIGDICAGCAATLGIESEGAA